MTPKKLLLLSLRTALGAVFVVSGFQKLTSPYQNFVAVIEKFGLLQGPGAAALARSLPWAEFVLGIFFIIGFWERVSLFALWAMNAVFIGVLTSALVRNLPIDSCGCFGEAVTLTLPRILALDVLLCALFFIFFLTRRQTKVPALDDLFGEHARR